MADDPIEDDEPIDDESNEVEDGDEPEDATDRYARFAWHAGEVTVGKTAKDDKEGESPEANEDDQKQIAELRAEIKALGIELL